MQPEISVIVIGLDCARTLKRAIDSILAQKKAPPYEIIYVDSESQDDSVAIAESLQAAGAPLTILKDTVHSDICARLKGARYARGRYLAFLDSDDFLLPSFLRRMYREIRRQDVDILTCSYYCRYHRGVYLANLFVRHRLMNKEQAIDALFANTYMCGHMPFRLYHTELFHGDDLLHSHAVLYSEDCFVLFQLLKRVRSVKNIIVPLAVYDKTGKSSITASRSSDRAFRNLCVQCEIRHMIDLDGDEKILRYYQRHRRWRRIMIGMELHLSRKALGKKRKEARKKVRTLLKLLHDPRPLDLDKTPFAQRIRKNFHES